MGKPRPGGLAGSVSLDVPSTPAGAGGWGAGVGAASLAGAEGAAGAEYCPELIGVS